MRGLGVLIELVFFFIIDWGGDWTRHDFATLAECQAGQREAAGGWYGPSPGVSLCGAVVKDQKISKGGHYGAERKADLAG